MPRPTRAARQVTCRLIKRHHHHRIQCLILDNSIRPMVIIQACPRFPDSIPLYSVIMILFIRFEQGREAHEWQGTLVALDFELTQLIQILPSFFFFLLCKCHVSAIYLIKLFESLKQIQPNPRKWEFQFVLLLLLLLLWLLLLIINTIKRKALEAVKVRLGFWRCCFRGAAAAAARTTPQTFFIFFFLCLILN